MATAVVVAMIIASVRLTTGDKAWYTTCMSGGGTL